MISKISRYTFTALPSLLALLTMVTVQVRMAAHRRKVRPPTQSGMPMRFMVRSDSASHPALADLYTPYGFFLLESTYDTMPPTMSIEG